MTIVIYEDEKGVVRSRYIDDGHEYIVSISPYGSLHVATPSVRTVLKLKEALLKLRLMERRR